VTRTPLRILGVDTSLRSSGFAVVEQQGSTLIPVTYGIIRNPAKRPHSQCLDVIYKEISRLIVENQPQGLAVEGIFFHKNPKTAMILGQARGVVLAAAAAAGLPVYEYAPRRVKQAVVGTGSAQKEQVARMMISILGLKEQPPSDSADALAIAICHIHSSTGIAALQTTQI